MGKKKRLQMQRKPNQTNVGQRFSPGKREYPSGQVQQSAPVTDQPMPANMEELEQQHAAWIARRGHAYISLAETARLWNRSPEQIIRWEQVIDENGY
jgi:hypothetical protein